MDYNTVKSLLDKYFAGETSLADEQQLREYFKREDIPEEWLSYRALFTYFGSEQDRGTSSQFDQRWSEARPKRRLRVVSWWSAAAAVVLLLVASWNFLQQGEESKQTATIDWSKYEPQSDAEALQLAKHAFTRTSSAMYQGLNRAATEVESVKKIMNWE